MTKMINGYQIEYSRIFPEGDYWRWLIEDDMGRQYLDGSNYRTREAAEAGLTAALESLD